MNRSLLLLLTLAACAERGGRSDSAACEILTDGSWDASGSCFGMNMSVDLTMNADDCSFSLDNWSMNHGDAPDGGVVDGDQVTLSGPGFDGCTGTVDGDTISGICPDSCAWELSHGG